MARPCLSRIRNLLRAENALLVHFSGLSNSSKHYYPDDMRFAQDNPYKTRCCSSVCYRLSTTGDHLWGQVGIIVDPLREDSVQLVKKSDGGTCNNSDNDEKYGDPRDANFTMEVMLDAIRRTESHDEWLVGPYLVRGAFVCNSHPQVREAVPISAIPGSEDIPEWMRPTTLQDRPTTINVTQVISDLALPVYSFSPNGLLVKFDNNGAQLSASITEIYPVR